LQEVAGQNDKRATCISADLDQGFTPFHKQPA
jgi:hypothetical protein